MGIITSLFNTNWHIYRVVAVPTTDMYEVDSSQFQLVTSSVMGRIAKGSINEPSREGAAKEVGDGAGYKNKLFVPSGTDIKVGDKIIKAGMTSERYHVDYINKNPGGLSNHHYECLVSTSDFMIAS